MALVKGTCDPPVTAPAPVPEPISAAESPDQGPSPEESLRMMRAFVGIKSRKARESLVEMLEDASRTRQKTPGSASE